MTETVKERIYREALEIMSDSDFMGDKYVKKFVKGVFKQIENLSDSTDKLSVEKLQRENEIMKKALTEISVIPTKFDDGGAGEIAVEIAFEALAAIGGEGLNETF
ncbi:hypothetical protein [Brucella sp. CMUL 015]|uniref:hypothetical protein n=1 Tax=Brucella sp. CMUL 015 TaxID=1905697 RepID=UPI00094F9B6B|nr:hypothetical protein [Brucella sp. CMUL 015]